LRMYFVQLRIASDSQQQQLPCFSPAAGQTRAARHARHFSIDWPPAAAIDIAPAVQLSHGGLASNSLACMQAEQQFQLVDARCGLQGGVDAASSHQHHQAQALAATGWAQGALVRCQPLGLAKEQQSNDVDNGQEGSTGLPVQNPRWAQHRQATTVEKQLDGGSCNRKHGEQKPASAYCITADSDNALQVQGVGSNCSTEAVNHPAHSTCLDQQLRCQVTQHTPSSVTVTATAAPSPAAAAAGAVSAGCVGGSESICAPLCDMVSCVLQLERTGFVRRALLAWVRQLLSLLAGDAIDDFVRKQLASCLSETNVSQQIHLLRQRLWPGGVYVARIPPMTWQLPLLVVRLALQRAAYAGLGAGATPVCHLRAPANSPLPLWKPHICIGCHQPTATK